MPMNKLMTILVAAAGTLTTWGASEWFVSPDGVDAVGRGSEAQPFKTLQYAVDAAAAGDTVTALPGDYDEGYEDVNVTVNGVAHTTRSRVVINKDNITLRAKAFLTSGKREDIGRTRIIGAHDNAGTYANCVGVGANAIRGIWVEDFSGIKIQGFTVCNAAANAHENNKDNDSAYGGGIMGRGTGRSTVIDCVVSNCVATRGAAIAHATAIRTLFIDCHASSYGCAARDVNAFNCVATRNGPAKNTSGADSGMPGVFDYCSQIVNCTIEDNYRPATVQSSSFWNCIMSSNGNPGDYSAFTLYNCVAPVNVPADKGNVKTSADQYLQPILGDFRLKAGCEAMTAASTNHLTRIPSAHRDVDFYGNPRRAADGSCFCGAIQDSVATKFGKTVIYVNTYYDVYLDGHRLNWMNYHYSIGDEPELRRLDYRMHEGYGLIRIVRYLGGIAECEIVPDNNDGHVVRMADSPTEVTYGRFTAQRILYVKPDADASTANGTYAKPYRTIQAAVNACNGVAGEHILVNAFPGTYAEGCAWENGCGVSNRVVFKGWSNCTLRLKSMEGPEKTFIVGAPDPDHLEDDNGRGPAAIRCVYGYSGAAISGFTLTGGYVGRVNAGDSDGAAARGGAVLVADDHGCVISDCIISNNVASRGAAAFGGTFYRCFFTDNHAVNNGTVRGGTLYNCIFSGEDSNNAVVGMGSSAHHCTVYGCKVGPYSAEDGSNAFRDGIVFGSTGGSDMRSANSVRSYGRTRGATLKDSCYCDANAVDPFVDAANGDWRVYGGTLACGLARSVRTSWQNWEDFYGNARRYTADGRTVAGAVAETVRGIVAAGGVLPNGYVTVPAGGTVDFTVSPDATRPCVGIVVGGVTNPVTAQITVDFNTLAYDEFNGITLMPVYGDTWYADAVNGSDSNFGGTPETAFKSLQLAVDRANATTSPRVVALPGTYGDLTDSGRRRYANDNNWRIPFRLVIDKAIEVSSRDGAETTIIEGRYGSGEDHRGDDAMHGVFVEGTAMLRGFTIRNGSVSAGTTEVADCQGGGVLGGNSSARVVECVIAGCVAARGAGARVGSYTRCRFIGNTCYNNGSALRDCHAYFCYFAENRGYATYYANGGYYLVGCTFASDNTELNGSSAQLVDCVNTGKGILYGNLFDTDRAGAVAQNGVDNVPLTPISNCVVRAQDVVHNFSYYGNDSVIVGGTALDANGAPVIGANAAVDALNEEEVAALLASRNSYVPPIGDVDLYGHPRRQNGRQDIGAVEADWTQTYLQALTRGLSADLDAANGDVVENLETKLVTLGSGELSIDFGKLGATGTDPVGYSTSAQVTSGTLTISLNGVLLATVAAADGEKVVKFKAPATGNSITYSYEGEGSATLGRLCAASGMTVFLR